MALLAPDIGLKSGRGLTSSVVLPVGSTAADVASGLGKLAELSDVEVSVAAIGHAVTWQLVFANTASGVSAISRLTGGRNARLFLKQHKSGLAVGGSFRIQFEECQGCVTSDIAFDVSADFVAQELGHHLGVGAVIVERRQGPFFLANKGYEWSVTFVGYVGNAPTLSIDASGMVGDNVTVLASEVATGNELAGSFRLRWMGHSTDLLPARVSAEGLKAELEHSFLFGEVVVSQAVLSKVVKQWGIAQRGRYRGAGG